MKKTTLLSFSLLSALSLTAQPLRTETPLTEGWTFSLDGGTPVKVDIPHDFSIQRENPFTDDAPGGNHVGHTRGGKGVYARTFRAEDPSKTYTLLFDGAYEITTVRVNGNEVGTHYNGYTPFYYDITGCLRIPGDNTLEVTVENKGENSRWYTGSGLYREVRMIEAPKVRIKPWGINISNVGEDSIGVSVDIEGDGYDCVSVDILDDKGNVVFSGKPGTIRLQGARKWDVADPYLYTARVSVKKEGKTIDCKDVEFGLRSISFSPEEGFLLNGKALNLRGGCLHHDNGFLGARAIKAAEWRRVKLLKDNGYNAVRCSHNPPSSEFLSACDHLGILVIDEFTDMWTVGKNPNDYSNYFGENWEKNLTEMMMRDRSHPCVIMWSIGNEIPKENIEDGVRLATMLKDKVKSLDSTRPVTEGVPSFLIHGGWDKAAAYFGVLDVSGYNYMQKKYVSDHEKYPSRIIYGSETYPLEAYANWKAAETLPYVVGDFVWSALDYIGEVDVAKSAYVEKIDTRSMQNRDGIPEGTDPRRIFQMMAMYSTPTYPHYLSWCGDIDMVGDFKPQGLYRSVLWDKSPVEVCVHEPIPEGLSEQLSPWGWPRELPSWNWDVEKGTLLKVRVFTKAPTVSLSLNGREVGRKNLSEEDEFTAVFEVPYSEGELVATAMDSKGNEIASKTLSTVGEPVKLILECDKKEFAGSGDLIFVKVRALDSKGRVTPLGNPKISIEVTGDGVMAASGNASQDGIGSVNKKEVELYRGSALVVLESKACKGSVTLRCSSEGIGEAVGKFVIGK